MSNTEKNQSTETEAIESQASESNSNTNNPFSSRILVLMGTFLLMFGAVFAIFYFNPYFQELQMDRMENFGGNTLMYVGFGLLAANVGFLLYVTSLFFRYKTKASVSDEKLPTSTVIVPAYNEGKLVYKTLVSLVKSDYPAEKLQIISIDDGSEDDTWNWMQKAKSELGSRVEIYQQPENKGKRHALHRGFHLGTGDIFVTVDSDSIVREDTLRSMASPFVKNKECGAVAGNVRVLNRKKALIPRMLNVSFAFSFEFVRSAQSNLGSVMCTPGALAAYRRDAVMNCFSDWINQKFMGKPSTIGEDRAMTNMILKQGYKVLFQRNAFVYTNIPERYKNLYKMFIRWERSNVRENIAMTKFAFGNFRSGAKSGTRLLLINQWVKILMAYPLMLSMLLFISLYPFLFISTSLVGILVFSSVQALFYAKRHNISDSFWAYPYSVFYTFSLFWITPYAIATASRSGWLTRGLPKNKVKKPNNLVSSHLG